MTKGKKPGPKPPGRKHKKIAPKPRPKKRASNTAMGEPEAPRRLIRTKSVLEGADAVRADLKVRVKTARGRTLSSARWLQRQLNDPYVARARAAGYRSRAAFKLVELNDRFKLIKKGSRVVDLGCAPGGWLQVAAKIVGTPRSGLVVGVDLQFVEPVSGTEIIEGDFLDPAVEEQVAGLLQGHKVDVVLSDMAASASGHKRTDHIKIIALCEAALDFADIHLCEGGSFCAKVLQGGTEKQILERLKKSFTAVHHAKPKASRQDSAEMYVVAMGFRRSTEKTS